MHTKLNDEDKMSHFRWDVRLIDEVYVLKGQYLNDLDFIIKEKQNNKQNNKINFKWKVIMIMRRAHKDTWNGS